MRQPYIKLTIFIFFVTNCATNAQTPTAQSDIDFLVDKIKHTYVGYQDKVKGNEFENIIKEVTTSKSKDTFANLSKLTSYFNDAHLRIFQKISLDKIDTAVCKINIQKVTKLSSVKQKNKYSGYWASVNHNSVIYLHAINKESFESYVVETKTQMPKGYCNIKMKQNMNGELIADFVSTNMNRFFLNFKFTNDTTLMGNAYSKWRKIKNYKEGYLDNKTMPISTPDFKVLDSNNVVIYMPSFARSRIPEYDSIIKVNREKIINSKNLIIDLRYNGGGSIRNYFPLYPFICTNVIFDRQHFQLMDDNYLSYLEKVKLRIDSTKDIARINRFEKIIDTAKMNYGKYIMQRKNISYNCTDTIINKIKNVAIITNYGCLSAA